MLYENGPYVQAACFCDFVLEDKSGTFSLIRLVDRVFHQQPGPNSPAEMPPFNHRLFLVVMLKAGSALGRNTVQIIPELPNGATKDPVSLDVYFEGEEKGANILVQLEFTFELEGLYWFDVKLGENLLTRVPIRAVYRRGII